MEIKLHNTTKIVSLNGVPARMWEGYTASGIPVIAFVTRLAVLMSDDNAEFEQELAAASAPSPQVEGIPLHLLI